MINPKDIILRLAGEIAVDRLEKRAARLPSEHLVQWTETAIVGTGRAYGDWQQKGRPESLDEARLGAASVQVVLEELARRLDAGTI